jgi:hypothetical protein
MVKCKVCGKDSILREGVCVSCIAFFKSKYGEEYQKRIDLFLKALEEFSTKFRRKK